MIISQFPQHQVRRPWPTAEDQAGTQQGLRLPAMTLKARGSACTLQSCSETEGRKGPASLPGCRRGGASREKARADQLTRTADAPEQPFLPWSFSRITLSGCIHKGEIQFGPGDIQTLNADSLHGAPSGPLLSPPARACVRLPPPSPSRAAGPRASSPLSGASWVLLPGPAPCLWGELQWPPLPYLPPSATVALGS